MPASSTRPDRDAFALEAAAGVGAGGGNADLRVARRPRLAYCSLQRWLLIVVGVAAVIGAARLLSDGGGGNGSCFFMVQAADPQFGIVNGGQAEPAVAMDWSAEEAMLDLAVKEVNRLRPSFLTLSGDMQNWLPQNEGAENGALTSGHGNVGKKQAKAVRACLDRLSVPLRGVTPGNHDLGEAVDNGTLNAFEKFWGPGAGSSFTEGGVLFVQLDSQLYHNASKPGMRERRAAQTSFLREQLASADPGIVGAVILTHIPPFLGRSDEPAGWGNWPLLVRAEVLGAAPAALVQNGRPGGGLAPRLVVAGHFHGNVERVEEPTAFGAPLEVVTSSSVTTPVQWLRSATSGLYTASEAAAIGAAPSGGQAFREHVLRDAGPAAVAERVRAIPSRAGVRIFEFCAARAGHAAGYRHAWRTLEALQGMARLSDAVGDAAFTPF